MIRICKARKLIIGRIHKAGIQNTSDVQSCQANPSRIVIGRKNTANQSLAIVLQDNRVNGSACARTNVVIKIQLSIE